MSERKSYLLRLPSDLMEDLMRWAKDDLRSFNAQVEWVLRNALREKRRDALIRATAFLDPPPAKSKKKTAGEQELPNAGTDGDVGAR